MNNLPVPRSVEEMNQRLEGTLMGALGIRYLEPINGNLRASMPVDERTRQPAGVLHGGASIALAETLGSLSSHIRLDPATHYALGLEINGNHIRAVSEGFVYGVCAPLHIGRTTHVWEIRITDEQDRLVCISRLTVSIRERQAKPPQSADSFLGADPNIIVMT